MNNNKGTNLVEKYDNPVIRSLIQLVPFGIGSGIDVLLMTKIKTIRDSRIKAFFDDLNEGEIELTEELIAQEDFLHSYFSTIRAVLRTRRKEKIKLFARLFKNSVIDNQVSDPDEYDDYLKILDDLSMKDIILLNEIKSFEERVDKDFKQANENFADPMNVLPEWHTSFLTIVEEKIGLDYEKLNIRIYRLESLGLFERTLEIASNNTTKVKNIDNTGRLTTLFYSFYELISGWTK